MAEIVKGELLLEEDDVVDNINDLSSSGDDDDDEIDTSTAVVGSTILTKGEEKNTETSALSEGFTSKIDEVDSAAGIKLKHSRNEKKARKALLKLGMKQVPGIVKVSIKKTKHIMIVLNNPEVYKAAGSDTYVIFGVVKIEDGTNQAHNEAARRFVEPEENPGLLQTDGDISKAKVEPTEKVLEDDELDETNVDLLMKQLDCTRSQAVKALIDNDHDVVNALLKLSETLSDYTEL